MFLVTHLKLNNYHPPKNDDALITTMKNKKNLGKEYEMKNFYQIAGISFLFRRKNYSDFNLKVNFPKAYSSLQVI